jgi:hypothetical protein
MAMYKGVTGRLAWRRSSTCADQTCVEVAADRHGVYLRDGKEPDGEVIHLGHAEWDAFRAAMKRGDFDLF